MKKILSLIVVILIFSCSTSSDDNGNSNTTVVPLAPTELDGALVDNQVALTWVDNSTNETGFKIDRKVGTGNWVTDYASVNADVVNYTDTSVSEGMTYSYRASSFNAVGKSLNNSNIYTVTITAGTVIPVPPANLIGTVASPTQINLSWADNSTNETGFKVERKTGAGTYAEVGATATDITIFNDSGLSPNTTYIYRVYSYNTIGNSTYYSNELTLTTSNNSAINVTGPNVTDIDGNTYQSVTNCGLTFTKQNLNVSKYSDGTLIPQVTDPEQWYNLTTGAWCYYNNDPANEAVYGKLYNWYAVAGIYDAASAANPALRKKLAPEGWHIPTDSEWSSLINCLDPNADGGYNFNTAGGKMKSVGTIQAGTGLWESPNIDATNESGFAGLPAGERTYNFMWIGIYGNWWSSFELTATSARLRNLNYNGGSAAGGGRSKNGGNSVRCVRD
jgi:uncharacterized protein (TIGR02145 family)